MNDPDFKETPVHLYENFYRDEEEDHDNDGTSDGTVRVFAKTDDINFACLMDGSFPEKEDEIAIDLMHADNVGIKVGDEITVGEEKYQVVGLIAYVNYSTLHEKSTDLMFDGIIDPFCAVVNGFFEKSGIEILFTLLYNRFWNQVVQQGTCAHNCIREETTMSKIYTAADQLIGHTPLLELTHIEKEQELPAHIIAKLKYFNPAGSVKDRIAKKMIDDAEEKGLLKEGSVIIEPTSGNTGIGLAAVAAAKGYRIIIVMPETMSVERRQLMRAYGAELVLSEGAKGMKGAIAKADELAKEIPNAFIPGQFVNPANPQAHIETNAGVAGGRFNDHGTGLQLAGGLGIVDHLLGNAILDRAGGVEVFQLGQNGGLQIGFLLNMGQLQQRSVANQLICGSVNLAHSKSPPSAGAEPGMLF